MAAAFSSDSTDLLCQYIRARDLEGVRQCVMDAPYLRTCPRIMESAYDCYFIMAVMWNNRYLAELLLDHSKDINHLYGNKQESLIHRAVREDDEEMVKVLIHFRANLNIASNQGFTPLGLALTLEEPNGTAIAKILVRSGAFPNKKTVISFPQKTKYTPLHIACSKRNFDFVKFLVEETFIQNDQDYLEEASSQILPPSSIWNEGDNKQLVLVEEKVSRMTLKSGREESPKSLTQRLEHLVNQGAGDGSTPLFMAACSGDLQIVEYLIKAGANPHFVCLSGNFFHAAVNSKSLDVIRKGFELGCDVNHSNSVGDTPLHLASIINLPEACALLLTGGADLNARGQSGETPLVNSILYSCDTTATVLIQHGADVNALDNIMKTPLRWYLKNDETTIRFFLLAGARFTRQMLTTYPYNFLVTVDPNLSSLLHEHVTQPRSLQALCGLKIRNQLISVSNGKSILWRIQALPIPNPLKDLVLLRRFKQCISEQCKEDRRLRNSL